MTFSEGPAFSEGARFDVAPAWTTAHRSGQPSAVLAVYWCCSVGTMWTLELHVVDRKPDAGAPSGPLRDWVSSGVPTELPAPEDQTIDLLAERELELFPDAEPLEPEPRTRSRRLVGYATADRRVFRLAVCVAEILEGTDPAADDEFAEFGESAEIGRAHPMLLAARWIEAGFGFDVAADWVRAGVFSPRVAQTLRCDEPDSEAENDARRWVPSQQSPWGQAG